MVFGDLQTAQHFDGFFHFGSIIAHNHFDKIKIAEAMEIAKTY